VAPCNPPLHFVANGSPGSAFPPPLDPSDVPTVDSNPGFADLASSLLDGLDPATDGSDQIASDAAAATDALDTVGTAMDATLDTILVLLDQVQPKPVDDALGAFAGAQPGAEQLVGDVAGVAVPTLTPMALLQPNGQASIILGGPPAQGGTVTAGAAPYTRHLLLLRTSTAIHNVDADGGQGPNPPFAGWGPVVQEVGPDGALWWVYLVQINPAQAGTFTGFAQYLANVTITGITGTVTRSVVFQVVVQ
jgi:hypothetical protein